MSSSKFWKGVLLGALAGGALSLLDRNTRETVFDNCQRTNSKLTYYMKHPQEAVDSVKESSRRIRSTFEEFGEEISFITEKIEELRELTPQVADIIKDTKKTLADRNSGGKDEALTDQI